MLNILGFIIALLVAPASLALSVDARDGNADDTAAVAVVNNIPLSIDTFRTMYVDHLLETGISDSPRARKQFLDRSIKTMLVVEQVRRSPVVESDAFKLEQARVERKLLIEGLLAAEVYSHIQITDADLRDMFVRINTSVSASHLYAPTKHVAGSLYARLQAGESFERLAAETFMDSVLANNGGSLGYFEFDEMDPAFEDAAHRLDVGEISEPVRTAQGYSIIRVDDRFVKPILTESEFATKKDRLATYISVRKRQAARREFLSQLTTDLQLELHDESVKSLFAELNGTRVESIETTSTLDSDTPLVSTTSGTISVANVLEEARYSGEDLRSQIRTLEKFEAFVRGVAIRKEIVDLARTSGVSRTQAYKTATEAALDEWLYERAWDNWRSAVHINDSEIHAFYQQHSSEMIDAERRQVWEIVVATEEAATRLADEVDTDNFGRLALMHSIRPGADHSHGYLGELALNELGVVGDIIFGAQPHSIVGPIPVGGRFAIFKVGEEIPAGPAAFERVESEVRELLAHDRLKELVGEEVETLLSHADVQINSEILFGFDLRESPFAETTND